MDLQQLKRVIEAILLAAAQPLSLAQLAALFTEEEAVTGEQLLEALQALADDCAERGIELKEVASGYRYQIREDVHPWVTRLWTERQTKYSRALLETLALIAYRQPITRAEIEQIRGVAVSSSIIKTLEEREWVRVVGYRDVPGRPALFGTSRSFLDYFNLKSLDELPPLAEIRDLDEYDPQLDLAPVVPPSLELPPEDEEEAAADAERAAGIAAAPGQAADETAAGALPGDAGADAGTAAQAEADMRPIVEAASAVATDTGAASAQDGDTLTPADDFDAGADEGAETRGGGDAADDTVDELDDAEADDGGDDYAAETDERWSDAGSLSDSDFPPDDDDVDPNDTTTSDDVPEHTA
ncbi:SMC-Scp complex subunit ScpB [Tahibacter caeni]|uniref:SMC-Scp complex subunit ScpB n=1 Tax=Tahibacter caeni TaxID=1453545 RepID=UPI0021473A42|nr:SMC-Scp complex subunit ScpB [Tahibacter caeni]